MERPEKRRGRVPLHRSIQLRFASSYLVIILGVLILLNTYPILTVQNSVFRMKQVSVQNQASVVASALSGLGTLEGDEVGQVLAQLDVSGLNRVMVTNESGLILYDTSENEDCSGKYALLSEITQALGGKDVFRASYTSEAFRSRAAVPVMYRSVIIGAVYVYEYDSEQAELLEGLENNLWRVTLVILLASVAVCIVISRSLTRRIGLLLEGILKYGGESYEKVDVGGRDEISMLAEEFNNLTDRLTADEAVRRRFVSDASHELKTPLASIRLLSDSILQTENMDGETMRDFVADIGQEADRLSRMTEKLLALTRLDAAADTGDDQPVDLCYVVERVLHMLQPLADRRQVKLESVMAEGCVVRASGDDLYQIVFNLAENAVKYNVKDGWVRLTLSAGENWASLVVEDSGIGIPKEEQDKVFDRFYRVDKARSREAGGAGLGLSIVHDMVVKYQGSIQVSSREEGGSVFRVVFPREVTE